MERVPKELEKLRESPDKDAVHDLRVAIRRCRSVGQVMKEIDLHPAWGDLRHLPRKLFRKLGELRDMQIMDEWVRAHGAENDKLRLHLQSAFEASENKLVAQSLHAAEKFDEKAWNRIGKKLRKRVRAVLPDGLTAQCLALERLQEAKAAQSKALRGDKPESWHNLRIAIKKLRYTTESLLPQRYQTWSPTFKQIQDLLGAVHDLDVLSGIVRQEAPAVAPGQQEEWERMIERERAALLKEYRELAAQKNAFWQEWRSALPQGRRLQSAALARLRATARTGDTHPRRTAQISRLSIALFDALAKGHLDPIFDSRTSRRIVRAAARLSGFGGKGTGNAHAPRKAARRFLMTRTKPPAWTQADWELLAWTVRYLRGAEPKNDSGAFAKLSSEQQNKIRALAGVIRLARGLRKCGIENCTGLHAETSTDATIVFVPGLMDSVEAAAHLAAAKHFLETYLPKPLILKPIPLPGRLVVLPSQISQQPVASAAASD
jgi:CHAD domain-containing protein